MKKILLLLMIAIPLAGCGIPGDDKAAIYDDDVRIAGSGDSWSYFNRVVDPASGETDITVEYAGFSGLHSLWTVSSPATASLTVSYESALSAGDLKTVLVIPDSSVISVFEGVCNGTRTLGIPAGTSYLKIVGRYASGNLSLQLEAADNAVVEKLD